MPVVLTISDEHKLIPVGIRVARAKSAAQMTYLTRSTCISVSENFAFLEEALQFVLRGFD